MPRKKKYEVPQPGGAVTDPENPPIRAQITSMAGTDIDKLIAEAPTNTNEGNDAPFGLKPDGTPRRRRANSKTRTSVTESENPLMDDPQYRKAVAGLNFFGVPRILKRGFKTAATVAGDETLDLDKEEAEAIDNYFYAVSKHTQFDPMATIVGRVVLLVLLIGELVLSRLLARTSLGKQLKELLTSEPETPEMQDNDSIRPGS